jgi:predicted metalloprotease with PDZ domain
VELFAFIFYLYDSAGVSGASGAHEHGTSSFYFMRDADAGETKRFYELLESVCSHEFYHIITPLSLRSTEIADFDFNNPRMSEHLWLYEGVTEYFAHFFMLRAGMMDFDEFCRRMQIKMNNAEDFNDKLPFTVMSRGAYGEHEDQYLNVYQKGALIGLCLDVIIRENSGGGIGLQDVINLLLEKYNRDKPFNDGDLFSEIEALSSPAAGDFLRRCIAGGEPLPFGHIAALLGAEHEKEPYNQVDFGDVSFKLNSYNYRLFVGEVRKPSKLFNALGLKPGDEIVTVNGELVNILNVHIIFGSPENSFSNGDSYELKAARFDKNGKEKIVELEAKISGVLKKHRHVFEPLNNLPGKQAKFRELWMGKR